MGTGMQTSLYILHLYYFFVREKASRAKSKTKATLKHSTLTHLSPVSHFYTPWKRQETFGFLTFSGGIEMWHTGLKWVKRGNNQLQLWSTALKCSTKGPMITAFSTRKTTPEKYFLMELSEILFKFVSGNLSRLSALRKEQWLVPFVEQSALSLL